jgi:hypothetical protein
LLDPITNEELFPDFLSKKSNKSYVNKGQAKVEEKPERQKESPKKEEKEPVILSKTEVKKEEKVETPFKAVKVENQ